MMADAVMAGAGIGGAAPAYDPVTLHGSPGSDTPA